MRGSNVRAVSRLNIAILSCARTLGRFNRANYGAARALITYYQPIERDSPRVEEWRKGRPGGGGLRMTSNPKVESGRVKLLSVMQISRAPLKNII